MPIALSSRSAERRSTFRRLALVLIILAIASILSLPAALYLWKYPDPVNALSLAVSLGFFASVFTLVRRFVLLLVAGMAALLMGLIEIVHIVAYGSLISLGGIEAILYVDPMEAREFAADHLGVMAPGVLILVLFAALAWWKSRLDDLPPMRRLGVAGAALLVPFGLLTADLFINGSKREVYLPTRILEHYSAYLGINPLTHTISGFVAALGERRELLNLAQERDRFDFHATRAGVAPERETYIVVVGESSRSWNWSLYGYKRPTNPRLAGLPGLTVFDDAVSPATTTGRSLPLSFSFAEATDPDFFYRSRSFLSAFREVGFKVWWLTNQGTGRTANGNQIALIMNEADETRSTNFGFWNTVLDEALLPELDRALADPASRKLIVLHTLGSHTNYRQRFPPGLELAGDPVPVRDAHPYAGIGDDEADIIADYDRTIAYTDWLLAEIIERHRAAGADGAVVYFSDHGQRLFDDDSRRKGHGFGDFRRQDVQIPLLVWLPDAFDMRNPQGRTAIRRNAALPVSTTDLAASMLDLAGIRIEGLDPARSFLGAGYEPAEVREVLTVGGRIVRIGNENADACDDAPSDPAAGRSPPQLWTNVGATSLPCSENAAKTIEAAHTRVAPNISEPK